MDDSVFRTSVACWLMLCVERGDERYAEVPVHKEGEVRCRVLLAQQVARADVRHPRRDVYVAADTRRHCCCCSDSG